MAEEMTKHTFWTLLQDGHTFRIDLGVVEYHLKKAEKGYVITAEPDDQVVDEPESIEDALLAMLLQAGSFDATPEK